LSQGRDQPVSSRELLCQRQQNRNTFTESLGHSCRPLFKWQGTSLNWDRQGYGQRWTP